MLPKIILKEEQSKKLKVMRHPWVFSGAVQSMPKIEAGDLCLVESKDGTTFGLGFGHPQNSIACRMLSFGPSKRDMLSGYIVERLKKAYVEKISLVPQHVSNAFRLINAEADGIPGLIVDIYDRTASIQISTAGVERHRSAIIASLAKDFNLDGVFEKSNSKARIKEGLPLISGWQWQTSRSSDEIAIMENGIQYFVNIASGQKTGFFIDQRDMRLFVKSIAQEKSVLNCFSYTGGFSLSALKGLASKVVSIDSSQSAMELLDRNLHANGFSNSLLHKGITGDVLNYLNATDEKFDVIILDPPGFIKQKNDLRKGFNHYLELNEAGLKRLNQGGILLTFSCSPFFEEPDFLKMVRIASQRQDKLLKVISSLRHALDHGVLLTHPEGRYLKGLVLKEVNYE